MNEIIHGDCLEVLPTLEECSADLVFADPPYFLSGRGVTCQSGKMVKCDKGAWDAEIDKRKAHKFNLSWLRECRRVLSKSGTIYVSGTHHNIHSVGYAMQWLGFWILGDIVWLKPTPPPNLSCRVFTHAHETVIYAARERGKHRFNYGDMRSRDGCGRQLKSVWEFGPPRADEYAHGKHPTQKPEALVERIVLATSKPGDLVVDPFGGSCTTAVVAKRTGRRYVVIEKDPTWVGVGRRRVAAVQGVQMDLLEAR